MKITPSAQNGNVWLESESSSEAFELGKLAAKCKPRPHSYSGENSNVKIECDIRVLVKLAAE